jgi:Zn finger protein HypA/HybF involved in hydrogenase expression
MMEVVKECKDCGKEFKTDNKGRYPRKYCEKCSKIRKKEYEKIDKIKFEDLDDE